MRTSHSVLVALALSLSVLAACGGAESRRASHMEKGQQYLAAGNFEKARVELSNALQIAPDDAEARFLSGRVAEKLGDIRGAVGLYQSTIDANPDHVQARANLGRVLVFAGAPDRAMEIVEPALGKHPDDPDLLTVRAAARMQLDDRAGALADAQRAVSVAPQNENAVALLASLHRQSGDSAAAIALLKTTLEKVPASVDLRQVLATLYLTEHEPALAEAQLRKVVELRPKELPHRYQLAIFYQRAGRLDEAEKVLKDVISVAPDDDDAKLAYVDFLAAQRSAEQGRKALLGFIARNPKDYALQLGLGVLQQRSASPDEAIVTYEKIIERDEDGPSGLTARNRIAAIHVAAQRYDEASRLIAAVLERNARDNDALLLRGNIALDRGDPTSAIGDLRAVLRDQPGATGVLRTLARAHLANDEPALAEEHLRAAIEAAPADTATRIELAQLLVQTRRVEQAVTLLEETVRAAPRDVGARETLVRAYIAKQDLSAARTAIEDVKTLRPDLAAGFYLGGLVARAQNREDDARREFERALELQPGAMDALAALAAMEVARGENAKALARVAAAVEREPQNAVARNLLGELHLAGKDFPKAVEQLTQATRMAPKWWLPHRNLAVTHLAASSVERAIAAYEAGVKATGHEPTLVADLAALYERQGRFEDAIRQYEALHQRSRQIELAANNLAMLLVTYKNDEASLDRARDLTAAFASSSNPALLDTHGWVRVKRGEVTEALPVLERAVRGAPDTKVIRYHLAMAQIKAGQKDKAIKNLESALAGATSFAGIEEARSMLARLKREARAG